MMNNFIDVDIHQIGTDKPTHNCVLVKKNGTQHLPMAGGEARRFGKEGGLCTYAYAVESRLPLPGEYTMDDGHVHGPFENGDTFIDFQGTVVATTDPELKVPKIPRKFMEEFIKTDSIRARIKGTFIEGYIMYFPEVDNDNYVTIKLNKQSWDRQEVYAVALEAMNFGMQLRQDQLNGYATEKSGQDMLIEKLDNEL
jgi:hypothetical protein